MAKIQSIAQKSWTFQQTAIPDQFEYVEARQTAHASSKTVTVFARKDYKCWQGTRIIHFFTEMRYYAIYGAISGMLKYWYTKNNTKTQDDTQSRFYKIINNNYKME